MGNKETLFNKYKAIVICNSTKLLRKYNIINNHSLADDLIAVGYSKLIDCLNTYDTSRNCKLSTYIYNFTYFSMSDYLKRYLFRDNKILYIEDLTQQQDHDGNEYDDDHSDILLDQIKEEVSIDNQDDLILSLKLGINTYPHTYKEITELTGLSKKQLELIIKKRLQFYREELK